MTETEETEDVYTDFSFERFDFSSVIGPAAAPVDPLGNDETVNLTDLLPSESMFFATEGGSAEAMGARPDPATSYFF